MHTPEFVLKFINDGSLKLSPLPTPLKVTYHDPCHLGRHMNIYDPPRKVLQSIEGVELVEMPRTRENARCCGSGGGVQSAYKELSNQMADTRVQDAIDVGANLLTSACPFCTYSLKTAAENGQLKNKLEVKDLSEIIVERISED
jgi:Fe-S oxidoreductase